MRLNAADRFNYYFPMQKHRINWPYGNPIFDAWELAAAAGTLVVRRNHALQQGQKNCQGWDIWLDRKYLGACSSCTLAELAALSRPRLKAIALIACCGQHADFPWGAVWRARPGWGGARPRAGRHCKAKERRVNLMTTVDRQTLELIDSQRGTNSRGEYIDLLVQGKLKI
jgi:hypothetical protein